MTTLFSWVELIIMISLPFVFIGSYILCDINKKCRYVTFRFLYYLLRPAAMLSFLHDRMELRFKKPFWKIEGGCQQCGQCCLLLALHAPLFISKRPYLVNVVCWYYGENFGFRYEGLQGNEWMMFSCSNLSEKGFCSIYSKRPRVCREYPFCFSVEKPLLRPDCGFIVKRC